MLTEQGQDTEILTYHSSCVWLIAIAEVDGTFEETGQEFEIPAHFQHTWGPKGIKSSPAETCGE